MTAADSLKALRLRAGLTQEQLAAKAGLDRSWLNQMERGKRVITRSPRGKLAPVLADELGMEVDEVVTELGADDPDPPEEFRPIHQRLQESEEFCAGLLQRLERQARQVRDLSRRVANLEKQIADSPGRQRESR